MQEPGSQSSLGPQGVASGSAINLLEPVAMFCDNSNGVTSTTRLMSLQEEDEAAEEDMVTSTPAPPAMEDKEKWKTPNRRYISNFGGISVVGNASSASVGNNSLGSASKSHPSRTPSSGPRTNPFDSHLSVDRLHLPTCSPSVFSIVVSPSQEESTSGRFWSLDQQARLFPAPISENSPWKQEMANSKVDPRVEDKTQEAIDLYFSQNHKILSPEEALTSTGAAQRAFNRSVLMESVGNSPELSQRKDNSQAEISILEASKLIVDDQNVDNNKKEPAVNEASSVQSKVMATSTQTILSMPPVLPPEVEAVLAKYCNFNQEDVMSTSIGGGAGTARSANSSWRSRGPFSRQQSLSEDANLSNTTLRRKLFDGIINEDESSDKENDDYAEDVKGKENYESTAMIISPGKLILTPKSNRIPSPNKSLSWSLSPVSRNKSKVPVNHKTPLGSSTPSKTSDIL